MMFGDMSGSMSREAFESGLAQVRNLPTVVNEDGSHTVFLNGGILVTTGVE